MLENITLEKRQHINREIRDFIDKTLRESSEFFQQNFNDLQIDNYEYSANEAIEELGLDSDLVNQLIEDYVIQVLKSKALFVQYLQELKTAQKNLKNLNYTPLKELTHKNLGVARNLRIKDGIKILDELMEKDDLDYLTLCVKALEFCAIRLKPKCAYKTLKLIDIKSSL